MYIRVEPYSRCLGLERVAWVGGAFRRLLILLMWDGTAGGRVQGDPLSVKGEERGSRSTVNGQWSHGQRTSVAWGWKLKASPISLPVRAL